MLTSLNPDHPHIFVRLVLGLNYFQMAKVLPSRENVKIVKKSPGNRCMKFNDYDLNALQELLEK